MDAYPFTRYGTVDAEVVSVAHDAVPADAANQALDDATRHGDQESRALTPEAKPMTDLVFLAKLRPVMGADGAGLLNLIFSDSSNVQVLEMQLYPSNWNSIRVFSEALGVAFVGIPATRGAVPGSSGLVDENALTAALAACRS